MSKRIIIRIILVLFLISLFIYLCFSDNGLIEFLQNPSRINCSWFAMAFFCQIINIGIDAFLTYKFINNMDKKIKIRQAVSCGLIGQFFSAITPGASGGQPVQIYALSKRGVDAGVTGAALTQKFVVYQTSLIGFSAMAILLRIDYFLNLNHIVYSILVIGFFAQAAVACGLLLVSFNKKITYRIANWLFSFLEKLKLLKNRDGKTTKVKTQLELFYNGNKALYKNKYLVLETYVLTIVQLTATFVIPYCIYRSFGLFGQRASDMISAQAFITIVSSLFPIPGASGAAEGAGSIFLSPFFDEVTIKPAVVLTRLATYYFTIIISAPFSLRYRRAKVKAN